MVATDPTAPDRPSEPSAGRSPAAWFARQLVGEWRALTVRYPFAGRPQSVQQAYSIARLDTETLVIEARTATGGQPSASAWVRYLDLPSTSGLAGIECRQGPLNQLNAPEPSHISRGALIGRTLLLRAGEEARQSERRTMLLGEAWMLTVIQAEGEPPLLELAERGSLSPSLDPGELQAIDSAAGLAALLIGDWQGERFHSLTGERVDYARSVSPVGESALLVRERLETPAGGNSGPSPRLRRLRFASRLDGRIELEQTPWRSGAEAIPSSVSTIWRGDLAGNVVTWTERQTTTESVGRLESHWLLIGRDLVIRMTQEQDGSWWFAVERRTGT